MTWKEHGPREYQPGAPDHYLLTVTLRPSLISNQSLVSCSFIIANDRPWYSYNSYIFLGHAYKHGTLHMLMYLILMTAL